MKAAITAGDARAPPPGRTPEGNARPATGCPRGARAAAGSPLGRARPGEQPRAARVAAGRGGGKSRRRRDDLRRVGPTTARSIVGSWFSRGIAVTDLSYQHPAARGEQGGAGEGAEELALDGHRLAGAVDHPTGCPARAERADGAGGERPAAAAPADDEDGPAAAGGPRRWTEATVGPPVISAVKVPGQRDRRASRPTRWRGRMCVR